MNDRDGKDGKASSDARGGGGGEGHGTSAVVPLFPWHDEESHRAALSAHVAAIAEPTPQPLDVQREAIEWAVRTCERIARDAADEADRTSGLTGDARRQRLAAVMADRVRALRWLEKTLSIAQLSPEERARMLRPRSNGDVLSSLLLAASE